MKKIFHRLLVMLLSLMLVIGMIPATVFAANENVTYLDEHGVQQTLTNESYTIVTAFDTTWETGWHVVDSSVTIDNHVTANGDVKLILKDGSQLNVNGGINVPKGSTFTIYGQYNGTGNLISTGTNGNAGIGGTRNNVNFGSIILAAKGKIVTTGDTRAAGIGGGGHMNNNQPVDGTIHIYQGVIEATGGRWAAGIGGGADSITNCKITIDGGTINTTGGLNNAGIGGTEGSKEIVINGGNIKAYGSGTGAGIGGSYNASGGNITITGGIIDTSNIGGGSAESGGSGGTIIISGGVVTADHIGAGGNNQEGTFSTTESGNAVIYVSSISDQTGKDSWRGLIFEGSEGKIYGESYTVDDILTIPEGKILTVESGKTLINNSTIINNGTIRINRGGTYSGNQPENKVVYQIDWDTDGNSDVDDTTYVAYGEMPTHDDGSKASTVDTIYTFDGWSPELASVTKTATYTAQFFSSERTYMVTLPENPIGYTVFTNDSTSIGYGKTFTFTVNINEGYTATESFIVKSNDKILTAQNDGSYNVTVTDNTIITVEGVADITPPENITVNYKTDNLKEFLNDITFGLFFNDTVTVTISATDEGSGVREISYQLGDGELQTVTTQNNSITFTVEPEFKGNIKNVTATDNDENTSESHNFEYFAVEKAVPTNVTVDTNGYESNTWTNDNVTLTVSGSTATSGIAKYQYSIDDGTTWQDMTTTEKTEATEDSPLNVTKAQLIVNDSKIDDYIFRAVSNAENVSAQTDSVTVKIDKTTPEITIVGNTQEYLTKDIIEITATADISDIVKVEMQKDNGEWTDITKTYENGYTVTENGTYTFRVTNGVGIVVSDSITYDKIDNVKPIVAIDSENYESNTWTNQDVTLSVSNTANNLGITTFKYKVNDGQWKTYTNNIVISDETDGTKYAFKAISASKVESDEVSFNVKIDKTAASGNIKIEENSVKNLVNKITFDLFFNKNVDVIITANDNLSGVDSVKYYRSEEILTEDQVNEISDWKDYNSISEIAEDTKKFVYYVKITDNAGNETYLASNGVVFDLTAPVIDKVENEQTYYVTQIGTIFDTNYKSTTINGTNITDTTFYLLGNKDETYVITATDKAGNSTTYTVNMKPIGILDDSIEGITVQNVKSENKTAIESVKDTVESIDLTTATDEEKQEIKNILDNCIALLTRIEESTQAGNTENIEKVENITADNVKLEDKEDLINAKEDLENALENFGDNYTEEEKTKLEEKLEQINNALESIEKVESVQDAINSLPETVEPDDAESEALIKAVKEQYDKLTEHQKTLISEELKVKLEKLLESLTDYRVIDGDKIKWTMGENGSITMTFNGPIEKFVRVEVDGKVIDATNYTVKSGSTIITLNSAYLNTLSVGKHTLTVVYSDGKASAEFEVLKKAESNIANTYDSSNIILWIVLLFVAGTILVTMAIKKQKLNNVKL